MSLQPPGHPYGWVMPPDMLRTWDPNRRLQPLAVVDLLGRSLRLYARNFRAMASIALAVYVPLGLLSGAVAMRIEARILELIPAGSPGLPPFNTASAHALVASTAGGGAADGAAATAATVVSAEVAAEIVRLYLLELGLTILIGLIGVIAAGALVHAAVQIYLGRGTGVGAAFRAAFGRLAELVCAGFLQTAAVFGLVVIGVVGVLLILLAMRSPLGGIAPGQLPAFVLAAGALAIIVLFITVFVSVRFAFYIPAVMLEDRGPIGGLGRSWALTRGSMLRIAGGTLLSGLLVGVIVFGEAFTTIAVAGPVENPSGIDQVARMTLASITSALVAPISSAFLALLYLDVRVRKEDFDIPPSPA